MYTFDEVRKVFARCKTMEDLERACDGFLLIISDGDLSNSLENYIRIQSHVKFRQLNS